MLIQVTDKVLGDTRWHPLLDVIAHLLEQEAVRHSFDPAQIRAIENSAWLKDATGIRKTTAEFIRGKSRASSRDTLSDAVTVRIDEQAPSGGERLGYTIKARPFDSLVLLTEPFRVIVENETADGGFLLWIARLLGRDTIARCYRQGRLVFQQAGGKGEIIKSARALTMGVWPRPGQPILSRELRTIAVLDSDEKYAGHEPNKYVEVDAQPYVAFTHILSRRAIESYLPEKYLRQVLDGGSKNKIDAFLRMPDDQRRYFPMKTGFKDANDAPLSHAAFLAHADIRADVKNLYRPVPAADWALFAAGFGKSLSSAYTEPRHRCEPQLEAHLMAGSQKSELEALLTRIIRHL